MLLVQRRKLPPYRYYYRIASLGENGARRKHSIREIIYSYSLHNFKKRPITPQRLMGQKTRNPKSPHFDFVGAFVGTFVGTFVGALVGALTGALVGALASYPSN
jgi:hypothetical protein